MNSMLSIVISVPGQTATPPPPVPGIIAVDANALGLQPHLGPIQASEEVARYGSDDSGRPPSRHR